LFLPITQKNTMALAIASMDYATLATRCANALRFVSWSRDWVPLSSPPTDAEAQLVVRYLWSQLSTMLIPKFDDVRCNVLCELLPGNDEPIPPTLDGQRSLLAALGQRAFPDSLQMGILVA
jgi:hypothetical protein